MAPEELMWSRIRVVNGNVRVILILLTVLAIAFWWVSLSYTAAVAVGGRSSPSGVDLWVIPIVMSIFGFVIAYITAIALLGIDRMVREMQVLTKAIVERGSDFAPGKKERGLLLKPKWPVNAVMWSFGLHATLATLASFGRIVVALVMVG
ncbi:MAG: hypothetical protein HRU13_13380 [Phycisphaerales bacterium]|nr:hypothetical protein [Phycisphaerales bacterium]